MQKEGLRKLKRINATPKMVQMAKDNTQEMTYRSTVGWEDRIKSTRYDVMVRCQSRGRILMIAVFFPDRLQAGEMTPAYEIYCNKEGDEYITRIMEGGEEKGWSTAMAYNLERLYQSDALNPYYREYYAGVEKRIWQNQEGRETIKRYLGTKKKGIHGLIEWQRKVKTDRILEKEKREQEPWDADMALVPEIMPSFQGWMEREAAGRYYIIYEYDKNNEAKEGWCSGCQKIVHVTAPRHNKEAVCKRCGRNVTYKAAGRIKTLKTGWYKGQCIQRIKGGIVVRTFEQMQWYWDKAGKGPHSMMKETERILVMDNGEIKRYWYGLYKNKIKRFILDRKYIPASGYRYSEKLYTRNLKSLKKTALKNSTIDLWGVDIPTTVPRYLVIEKSNPAIEKLVKIGMFRLAEEIMNSISWNTGNMLIDRGETELTRMLRIDRARLKRLRAIDGGVKQLTWYQYEKAADRIWPDEMIRDFGDNDINTSTMDFLNQPLQYVSIWNYIKKQKDKSKRTIRNIVTTWRDYLNMAQQAGMDVKNERIWKPKDLQAAHNELVLLLQEGEMEEKAAELAKKWPKVNGILPRLKKFEYADKDFTIRAPNSILDIVKEGISLQHCVHTCDFYFDRIQKDETYLFFLRRTGKEGIPWYTLEVEAGGNIRQKRTTGDNQNKDFDEAVKFLKKWQKFFVKRLTEEEKELGKRADKARQQEYAKLRRDGNKVWHGKLAGKLLADVLEEDFMAVI